MTLPIPGDSETVGWIITPVIYFPAPCVNLSKIHAIFQNTRFPVSSNQFLYLERKGLEKYQYEPEILTGDIPLILAVHEGKHFRDGGVQFGGNEGADIQLRQRFDKIRIVADRDVLLLCNVENLLRNAPRAFGKDAGGGFVILVVAERHGKLPPGRAFPLVGRHGN